MTQENITAEDFDRKIMQTKGKKLVAFHAEWCPFCRKFIPLFRKKEGTTPVALKESLVNEDENPLWSRFNIQTVPTLIAFENGKEIARRDAQPGIGLSKSDLDGILADIA